MDDYLYLPMTIDDYDEVYALWRSIPGVGLSRADSRQNIAAYLLKNPGQSFICKYGGEIAGAILCGNDGRRAYIHHAAVRPEHRRRGIGARLAAMAIDAQEKQGISKCHLFIFNDNGQGRAFWQRMGFAQRGDIAVMSKDIDH